MHVLSAARKKRRGRGGDDSGDDSTDAVPPEQNHSQIIQYMPPNNGEFSDSFLRSLTQAMPAGNMPASFEDAFNSLQLGQVRLCPSLHAQWDTSKDPSVTAPVTTVRLCLLSLLCCGTALVPTLL